MLIITTLIRIIDMTVSELREIVDEKRHRFRSAAETLDSELTALEDAKQLEGDLREAVKIAQQVAADVQAKAHQRIAQVVSRSLSSVFGPGAPQFKIRFEQKRGKTEALLLLEQDGLEMDPLTATGGGVVDVASFALRLSCLMLSNPPLRRVLVLDEPFKMLSMDYREAVRELLETLARELGVQIIQVTHSVELVAGKVIHVY
jgi:DNA repair exonuclease SbcCD ATPase subunit